MYLVALKAWHDSWGDRRINVAIRSDNIGALFMGAQMKSKASPIISKEVALLYGDSAFEPRVFHHLPGAANGIADTLSRMAEPGFDGVLPKELSGIIATEVPVRKKQYYIILTTS